MKKKLLCCCSLALAVSACTGGGNNSGNVSSTKTGDLSIPPAPRVASFDEHLREACGDASLGGAILREPYLQQVGGQSAMVMFKSELEAKIALEAPSATALDDAPSELDSFGQQLGVLGVLEPSTTYCYRVEGPDGSALSRAGFRSAPAAGSGEDVPFVVLGDMGSGSGDQYAVLDQLKTVRFDLMITTGDNAYPDGTLEQYEQNFFAVYEEILRSVPVFPSLGNHDYHTDNAGPYLQVFSLPENGGPTGVERWYSFDWGDVHFVALDTERFVPEQVEWLEQDLAQNELPWVIVYGHHPPYSSGDHGSNLAIRETLAPIFARHDVRVYLAGHDHHYERSVEIDGTTYIVTGGGGRGTRATGASDFTAFSDEVLHFMWGRVRGDQLELHAIDATGREFDSVLIER